MEKTEAVKVSVFGYEDAAVLACQFPHVRVSSASAGKQPHMKSVGKDVVQLPNQGFRELFVEEQTHGSSRDADCSALTLGRVGQTRANVILRELWEIGQQFGL